MSLEMLDHLLALLLIVAMPFAARAEHRSLLRKLAAGRREARLRAYHRTIAWQWGLSLLTVALWWRTERALADLGLVWTPGRGAWLAGGAAAVASLFFLVQAITVVRSEERLRALAPQFDSLRALLPHDRREGRWFSLLSVTAGICEELLYRGFLIAYLARYVGVWPAVLISSMAFGLGHLYQGPAGIVKTFGVGLVMAVLYRFSGSLWGPMLLHATIDITSGWMGRRFTALPPLRKEQQAPPEETGPAQGAAT